MKSKNLAIAAQCSAAIRMGRRITLFVAPQRNAGPLPPAGQKLRHAVLLSQWRTVTAGYNLKL
jgi:hypothetical protein